MTSWLVRYNPTGQASKPVRVDLDESPCPTIMAGGLMGDNLSHYWLEEDMKLKMGQHGFFPGKEVDLDTQPCPTVGGTGLGAYSYSLEENNMEVERTNGLVNTGKGQGHGYIDISGKPFPTIQAGRPVRDSDGSPSITPPGNNKPPYRVPLMPEIEAIPLNGLTVVSTFSGCGGGCLGFRMAGFKVVWASEFVPAAQEVYKLNHPNCHLDTRDIRLVQPEDILETIGLRAGELDVLEGSPPCASFSTAGKRQRDWGKVKKYSDTSQRTDDLFFEFARLLKGLQPRIFVAENVSGLVKGVAKGYFKEILATLKDCGYIVEARLLDAQWLGVPQMRQRIIFVGVRNDLGVKPAFPKPLSYRYSVREALPWITTIGTSNGFGHSEQIPAQSQPYHTVGTGPQQGNGLARFVEIETLTARVMNDTGGQYSEGEVTDRPSPTVDTNPRLFIESEIIIDPDSNAKGRVVGKKVSRDGPFGTITAHGVSGGNKPQVVEPRAYRDKRGAYGNDGDITEEPAPTVLGGSVGTHWIVEPETDISQYAIGKEWDKLGPGEQSDKYYQLVKPDAGSPCPTVTQRGGDNTVASVTHPTERRKFTIAELKRICAFPDDFKLTGSYAQQWERLGRAVPPIMMYHVARVIRDEILFKLVGREAWEHDPPDLVAGLKR